MRNIERIKPFLAEFEKAWLAHPDLRFGQLVSYLRLFTPQVGGDIYYIEDEDMVKALEEYNEA